MASPSVYVVLLGLFSTLGSVAGDGSVYTKSAYAYGQSLTSSTLQWLSVDGNTFDGVNLPKDIVESGQEATVTTFVCRAYHSGLSLIGSSDGSSCSVVFFDAVHTYNNFEVLVNPGGAGRLIWKSWSRSTPIPEGTVENSGHYAARYVDASGNRYVGRLDATNNRGKIFVSEQSTAREHLTGEILVEVEAVKYQIEQLEAVQSKKKILAADPITLAETTLENMENEDESAVSMALAFESSQSVYLPLTNISGVNKILPAYVKLADVEDPVPLKWGHTTSGTSTRIEEVTYKLAYGTAVKVSVVGTRLTFQGPYTASMMTTYADSEVSSRRIEGIAKQTILTDIRAIYGEPYFVSNGSLVPTSTTTVSTTVVTTPTEAVTTISTGLITEESTNPKMTIMDKSFEDSEQLSQPMDEPSTSSSSTWPQTSANEVKTSDVAWIQDSKSSSIAANVLLVLTAFLIVR